MRQTRRGTSHHKIATPTLSRRTVLRGAVASAGAAALAACGGDDDDAPEGAPEDVPEPEVSYPPRPEITEGRIASGVEGVPDAYYQLPEPYPTVLGPPGNGGPLRAMTIAYNPPPNTRGSNEFWQELEERLGVEWDMRIVPQPNYGETAATMIAGGELGDLFYINPGQNAWDLFDAINQGAFADLTPFVTGDALQEYPNLADPTVIAPQVWEDLKINDKIYGTPKPILRDGGFFTYRADWAENLGISPPTTPDDLFAMLVAFAHDDPDGSGRQDTWGLGSFGDFEVAQLGRMFGLPNNWRLEDGGLVKDLETPEYEEALEFTKRLYDAGGFHPDAAGMSFDQYADAFFGGVTGFRRSGPFQMINPVGGMQAEAVAINPEARLAGLQPPGPNAVSYNRPGFFGFNAIPASVASDEERVRELLRVINYLMAPVGSEEWRFLTYGIEGMHHDFEDGFPVRNDQGTEDIQDLVYSTASEYFYFLPGAQEEAQQVIDLTRQILEVGIDDPTATSYSPTQVSEGAPLGQFVNDSIRALVTGGRPLSEIDDFRQEWRDRGGDTIRQEFEEAIGA